MGVNHEAKSLTEAFGLDDKFLVFYTSFVIVEMLKRVPEMGVFSAEIDIHVEASLRFWKEFPKLKASMSEKEVLILFQIGTRKASDFLLDNIKDQDSYDHACEKMSEHLKMSYNDYKK